MEIVKRLRVSTAAISISRALKRYAVNKFDIYDSTYSRIGFTQNMLRESRGKSVFILVAKHKEKEYKIQKLLFNLLKMLDNEVRVALMQRNILMGPLTEDNIVCMRTNLQYISGFNSSIQFVRRTYKTLLEAQTLM